MRYDIIIVVGYFCDHYIDIITVPTLLVPEYLRAWKVANRAQITRLTFPFNYEIYFIQGYPNEKSKKIYIYKIIKSQRNS